jgi:hypothetical protein
MGPFMEAFSCAASVYGTRSDMASDLDLARSFMKARREVAEWPRPDVRTPSAARAPDQANRVPGARTPSPPCPHARAGAAIVRLLRAAWNKK